MVTDKTSEGTPRPYRLDPLDPPGGEASAQAVSASSSGSPSAPIPSAGRSVKGSASLSPQPGVLRPFRWDELDASPARPSKPSGRLGERLPLEPADGSSPEALARATLEQARGEAERIVGSAAAEAETIRQLAHREGFEAGEAEGRRRAEEAVEAVEAIAAELGGYKASLYQQAREQVVELVLALVGKLLGPLAESDQEAVVRVVERALQLLADRESLTIRVHPEDLRSIIEAKPRILEAFDGIRKLTVVEDPSVRRGGCVVQTPTTEIDARLDTQLQEIARGVRSA